MLEDVIHAARTHGGDAARRAAEVLERWDRQMDAESRGAILFQALVRELGRRDWPRGTPWDADWTRVAPLATPDGVSDARLAAQALEAAVVAVERTHGALDTPWGAVYRLRRDSVDLPANGGPGSLGIFRVTGFERAEDGQFRANAGDSFIAAIEFGTPVRARALLAYGNASQAGSPHRTDQLPLYAAKQLRDVLRSRADIERNLLLREAF
jgi:acyl-homoserine-lactone acylase